MSGSACPRQRTLIDRATTLYLLSADKLAAVEAGRKENTEAGRQGSPLSAGCCPAPPRPPRFSQDQSCPGRHILPDNKSKLTSSFLLKDLIPLQSSPLPHSSSH